VRKSDLKKNHKPLDEAITRYRGFVGKVLNARRVVGSAVEKRDIAESVLLRLCANWERFLDEHLVDCVNCDHSRLSEYFAVTIPPHPSWDLCHALIIGDSYKDFKSFGQLKGFTKRILPDESNPILSVSKLNIKKIDEVYTIRNYLSHYSQASRRSLQKVYKNDYGMGKFVEPGQFLLAHNARRLWSYFDAFQGASDEMKACY
jgi:hypothetical protein